MFKTQVEPRTAGEWLHCKVLNVFWRRFVFYNNIFFYEKPKPKHPALRDMLFKTPLKKLHAIRPTAKTTKLIFRLGFATGTPRTMTTDKVRYYAGTTHSNIIIRFFAAVRNPKQDETIVLQCGPALIFISRCIKLAAFLVRV